MSQQIIVGLNAVILTVEDGSPSVLTLNAVDDEGIARSSLPFGPLDAEAHRTLESGLKQWIKELVNIPLGYVEQLYSFGDRDRYRTAFTEAGRVLSIGYMALTRPSSLEKTSNVRWHDWYDFFPWEDWRQGEPKMLNQIIRPSLRKWADQAESEDLKEMRHNRIDATFGSKDLKNGVWDIDRVLDRYELLYEANLVFEAIRDQKFDRMAAPRLIPGRSMDHDHRRILATAIGRLRGKIKFRPVIFQLVAEEFTLLQLQKCIESLLGKSLHKQNFRRLIDHQGLVEECEGYYQEGRGRPARLYRFRKDVLREQLRPGVKLRV